MANGWTTPEEEAAKTATYEQMLVERFDKRLPMSNWDKRDARRIKAQRRAFAAAEKSLA